MIFNFDKFPILKTERFILRKAVKTDAKRVFELRSNVEINKFVGTKLMTTVEEGKSFLEICDTLYQDKKRIYWLMEFQNKIIGSIVLHKIDIDQQYAEIGYKLKTEFQRKGLMTEAIQKVIHFGTQDLNLKTIEAFTHKNNQASIALLKKHHFKYQAERRDENFSNNRIYQLEIR